MIQSGKLSNITQTSLKAWDKDLETLGHVFSASNQLASITCYMSKYCQQVFINLYFHQWDDEKYENLGNMLYNNYTQALKIINVDASKLDYAKKELKINEGALKTWHHEQKVYFSTLGQEPEQHVLKIAYVEHL
ncbi:hypothetical protein C0995_002876 [Termitomyces sp. Mi166|nr:hypothetical protein C0995_002876 [Termitomyces sp. Mi166\